MDDFLTRQCFLGKTRNLCDLAGETTRAEAIDKCSSMALRRR